MTDIVERLRDLTYVLRPDECKKAADIIEQLQAEIGILRYGNDCENANNEKIRAENEKLRAENERLHILLMDFAQCEKPGESTDHCGDRFENVFGGKSKCPFSVWCDGPICSLTGMYIGDDPRVVGNE
jgi:hypothetical protein